MTGNLCDEEEMIFTDKPAYKANILERSFNQSSPAFIMSKIEVGITQTLCFYYSLFLIYEFFKPRPQPTLSSDYPTTQSYPPSPKLHPHLPPPPFRSRKCYTPWPWWTPTKTTWTNCSWSTIRCWRSTPKQRTLSMIWESGPRSPCTEVSRCQQRSIAINGAGSPIPWTIYNYSLYLQYTNLCCF